MPFQRDLARESEMQQSRISMFETPGAANMTLETIAKIAAGLRVGVIVKFVSFSEMLRWENLFSPDSFDVARLSQDKEFINPTSEIPVGSIAALSAIDGNDLGATEITKRPAVSTYEFAATQNEIGA
jgi:transcriptional regulator with XRE-family HTH domain